MLTVKLQAANYPQYMIHLSYVIVEYEWEEVAPPRSLCLVCLSNAAGGK